LRTSARSRGTSGPIFLTSGGIPFDKPVVVVELNPGQGVRGTLNLACLGWPT